MATTERYGCLWPDGGYTGGISELWRDTSHYAKQHNGTVYLVGGPDDPEIKEEQHATHREELPAAPV